MQIASFLENLNFDDQKIVTKVIIETPFSKELRILLSKGQTMKEHKTPYPILIQVVQGAIELGISGKSHPMLAGEIMYLEPDLPHDLHGTENAIVRLSLSKHDKIERVKEIANQ